MILRNSYELVSLMELLQFDAGAFWRMSTLSGQISPILKGGKTSSQTKKIIQLIKDMRVEAERLNLQLSIFHLDRMEEAVKEMLEIFKKAEKTKKDVDNIIGDFRERMGTMLGELSERIEDELKIRLFLHVDTTKRGYYENNQFGQDVVANYPSAQHDMIEAGRCFALGRHTACVYHLMRTMELGLHSLADTLKNPKLDPEKNPNWGEILKKLDEELKKGPKNWSKEWQSDNLFFADLTANFWAVKTAWRNPTMHVGAKHTEEEAHAILIAVKGFMAHLATKLSEPT